MALNLRLLTQMRACANTPSNFSPKHWRTAARIGFRSHRFYSHHRMPPKLFLTGGTGYIGGSVLAALAKEQRKYDITVLLRNPPADFSTQYPSVKVVRGDFDSFDIISNAAAGADIAIHNGDGDHENALRAIIDGLLRRAGPSYLIKLSGTGEFYEYPDTREFLGRYNPKTYSDVKDIGEILSRPPHALHRHTDAIVQEAGEAYADKLKTAVVCPPDIYGRGHGPGRQLSYYISWFVQGIRKVGAPFYLNEGSNIRGWVHIDDFTRIYVSLVEAAAAGGGHVTWGKEGYFLAQTQEFSQKDIAEATAKIMHAKGMITAPGAKSIGDQEMRDIWPNAPDTGIFSFACNSRTIADRAAKELGYVPKAPSFWDTLESDLMDAYEANK